MQWTRKSAAGVVWVVTVLWAGVLLASLRYGLLNGFFFDGSHAHVQGIDFFPVVRAFLGVAHGGSAFDTFSVPYGPCATWFLYHPVLALALGPWLAWMSPWTAYAVWSVLSLAMMAFAAWILMQCGSDPLRRALVALVMLGAFPTFVVLYSGNIQAVMVLAVTLVMAAIQQMATLEEEDARGMQHARRMLMAGLLISMFSKPVVLIMLPLLLLLKETRRTALKAVAIYGAVSLAFVVVPLLNPVAMSWSDRIDLATHPAVVQQTMNVYTNGFVVTPPMKDNVVHWLAMEAFTDFRFMHIDVESLPVFLDGWLGVHTPDAIYRLPAILILELSVLVALLPKRRERLEAALQLIMAASLSFLLMYSLIWEYHYTAVLPVLGIVLMRKRWSYAERAILALGVLIWLPSLYFLVHGQDPALLTVQTLIRVNRVVPALAIFCILIGTVVAAGWRAWGPLLLGTNSIAKTE